MCFPNRKQKANFTDVTEKRDNGKATKAPTTVTTPLNQNPPTIPPITDKSSNIDMSSPKVAIVIYSMYGHIAKRMLAYFFIIIRAF